MKPLPPVSRLDLDHILEHTRDLWGELRGERIFITGGTGFFGCWLLESFTWAVEQLGLDTQIFVLTRSPDTFRQKVPHLADHRSVTLIQGDVRNFDFIDGEYTYVIHAATESVPPVLPSANKLFCANLQGTARVLEFCQNRGTKKLLFTSSGAVYGKQPPEITHLPEDYLGAPQTTDLTSAYGQSKRGSEFLCVATAQELKLDVKIARCFSFVGPYLPINVNYAVGNFVRDALNGGSIIIQGDGTPYRSYLYGSDLAIWLWTILFRGERGKAYNVGSDSDLNIVHLAEMVRNVVKPDCQITMIGKPDANHLPDRYVPSVQRARQELGLDDWLTLSTGIQRMAKWNLECTND